MIQLGIINWICRLVSTFSQAKIKSVDIYSCLRHYGARVSLSFSEYASVREPLHTLIVILKIIN